MHYGQQSPQTHVPLVTVAVLARERFCCIFKPYVSLRLCSKGGHDLPQCVWPAFGNWDLQPKVANFGQILDCLA